MILYVNDRNEIKDVNSSNDTTLKEIVLSDKENPFENWSIAKICCYRVGLTPETATEIIGYEDVTYTDIITGEEVTETRAITETKETGKYFVSMYTPYVNSLIIEHLDRLGEQNGQTEETVTNLEIAVCENYESAEEYKESTNSQIDNLQLAVVEVYEMLLGGI